jgi:hypothetical protein
MPIFPKYLLITSILLCLPIAQSASAQSVKDIQDYCQSMGGSGMSDEDSKAFIDECIAEQSSYLEREIPQEQPEQYEDSAYQDNNDENSYQEPQYEQEEYGQEQNCYAKVDENIQKLLDIDSNSVFDYDQLVDQCLKGNL